MSATSDLPLIALSGPTASGKSALAVGLAQALNGEVVSCDSVAVYRLMDVGSAKPSPEERASVPHHCIDIYWPDEPCTAGDYARAARAAIADISSRGRLPILAGGTGLYMRAVLEGLAPAPPRDEALRERIRNIASRRGAAFVHRVLQRLDVRAAQAIHPNDLSKVIRSIEVTLAARAPQSQQWAAGRDALAGYRVLHLGLGPERAALYDRINSRAGAMFENGLIAESSMLRSRFGEQCASLNSLGYAQALQVLRGEIGLEEAIAAVQQGHRNYAKRQMTWFRSNRDMRWLQGFGSAPATLASALHLAEAHIIAR